MTKVQRALISVSNKEGLVELGKELEKLGIEILSTGGTAKKLKDAGVKVKDVSEYTGFPEMMEGRVKTLHPKVHGGLLALRDSNEHMETAKKHGIEMIDLVVVNLYPFKETISKKNVKLADAIENIDIGGPTMIRSAAKNHGFVAVVVDPNDYPKIVEELKDGEISSETKNLLALKAFEHTASYDSLISNYLNEQYRKGQLPKTLNLTFDDSNIALRYGENPHQKAGFYTEPFMNQTCISNAKQIFGERQISYNNIFDTDGAFELVKEFKEPAATIIKHANPCGVAVRDTIEKAFEDAYNVDPMSAFGCIVALNRKCNLKTAELMKGKFMEVLIAPGYDKDAMDWIKEHKKNLRVLEVGDITKSSKGYDMKKVVGGMLIQTREWPNVDDLDLNKVAEKDADGKYGIGIVSKRKPTKEELEDLKFAWKVNKHVKSNSVVFCKNKTAYGIGAGQMSRVDASIIAKRKSDGRADGGVMSSDAFFPFPDAVDEAAKAGIKAVIHPGGAKKDAEVIETANKHGMAMLFTGVRLFKH
ncbi:bifunctional phosphoribosylaminoimidazolecarboxamide formyltransferase/IMP cyclohydrolase [Nanoarchaeota archaeon]